MRKFKVGDRIVGMDKNFVGEVTNLDSSFEVKILQCDNKSQVGKRVELNEKYFESLLQLKAGDRVRVVKENEECIINVDDLIEEYIGKRG